MDEIELRLGAVETALIEVLGLIDPVALADAARSLRERAPDSHDGDEEAQRLGAAQLLEDAARRWRPPVGG